MHESSAGVRGPSLHPIQSKTLPLLLAGNINAINPLRSGTVCVAWLDDKVVLIKVIICCYEKVSKRHCYVECSAEVDSISYISAEQFKPASQNPECSVFVSNSPKYAFLSKHIMYGFETKHYEIAGTPTHQLLTLTDLGQTLFMALNNIGKTFSALFFCMSFPFQMSW